ncbi:hypothetical protein DICVIV_04865 [Dictyocaulus viviparus]|uniref:Uncharacterized protein n=1 Tax=Dictyocaulus viviparus TaxID=29172 RepID=A0A0D8XYV1_DICVI|nr:hypothetical protein DICVIV_04865 [Dictyocaulus viviparus]
MHSSIESMLVSLALSITSQNEFEKGSRPNQQRAKKYGSYLLAEANEIFICFRYERKKLIGEGKKQTIGFQLRIFLLSMHDIKANDRTHQHAFSFTFSKSFSAHLLSCHVEQKKDEESEKLGSELSLYSKHYGTSFINDAIEMKNLWSYNFETLEPPLLLFNRQRQKKKKTHRKSCLVDEAQMEPAIISNKIHLIKQSLRSGKNDVHLNISTTINPLRIEITSSNGLDLQYNVKMMLNPMSSVENAHKLRTRTDSNCDDKREREEMRGKIKNTRKTADYTNCCEAADKQTSSHELHDIDMNEEKRELESKKDR